ncbi:MAG: type II secretion system F family protein [Gammaproteobacteria bacterium]|nr:MAG: type II secretion system F family protein [Gammaproteobacteria bacterium]
MAEFLYRAVRRDGTIAEGQLSAVSQDAASRDLRQQGLTPLQLSPGGTAQTPQFQSKGKMPTRDDVLAITSELSVLLRSGLPIDRGLKVLIDMSHRDEVSGLLTNMLDTVKGGKRLSQALESYGELFGSFYISMVRSGETSGHLSDVMSDLTAYLENAKAVRGRVTSALIYPMILFVVATLSVIAMLGFVVPQFEALFLDMGDALPLLTRGVIGAGDWLKQYGLIVLLVLSLLGYFLKRWLKTENGKRWLDEKMLKLPVLGGVVFKYEIAKFSRTMGTLLGNGVSILQSISIATGTVGNVYIRDTLQTLDSAVKQGVRMSVAMEEAKTFTPMVIQMVRVGEESGNVDKMMLELARVYENEVEAGVSRSLTLLEPLLILGMGLVIAVIIIAILMGILSVNDVAM